MKTLSLILAALTGILILGCQDNMIMGSYPETATSRKQPGKIFPAPVDQVITLNGTLANPKKGGLPLEINSELVVSVREIPANCAWTLVEVGIQARAELRPQECKEPIWRISWHVSR